MIKTKYMPRNRQVDYQLNLLSQTLGLITCYKDKYETILKNDDLIISKKKKYIFLSLLSDESDISLQDIYGYLRGGTS